MKYNYEVTVAVMTYHPDLEKMKRTIKSALLQKDVSMEIIVADDGSLENYFNEVEAFFKEENFTDYKMLPQPENSGTVLNVYKALSNASGKYLKMISPGDYLNGENCLREWVDFMEEKDCKLSFSDMIAYKLNEDGSILQHQIPAKPSITEAYDTGDLESQREWILWMNDLLCGAALLADTDTLKKYVGLMTGKVKYAEDFSVRLAIADGIIMRHFSRPYVWYECDTGISSGASDKWTKIIDNDFIVQNEILLENKEIANKLSPRYRWTFKNYGKMPEKLYKICKILIDPMKGFYVIRMKREERKTLIGVDESFLEKIW